VALGGVRFVLDLMSDINKRDSKYVTAPTLGALSWAASHLIQRLAGQRALDSASP